MVKSFADNRDAISMRSLEIYMTIFFLLFIFMFFMLVVVQVRMQDIRSRSSIGIHELAFEIAERVSSTEYLIVTEKGGQKRTAVFDPIKLSVADYEKLRDYLQEKHIDWEIEIYDIEGSEDASGSYIEEINQAYSEWMEDLTSVEEIYANEMEICQNDFEESGDRRSYEQCLKRIARERAQKENQIEIDLINKLKDARKKYDCSSDVMDWHTDDDGEPECKSSGMCIVDNQADIITPSNTFNILKCGYWRIGPKDLRFEEYGVAESGIGTSDEEYHKFMSKKFKIKRRIVYEFPCAISYYCDTSPITERKRPIHLGVLRVSVIEWDY